jgi:VWFA-related protein
MHPHFLARPLWPCAVAVALLTGASVGAQNPPAQPSATQPQGTKPQPTPAPPDPNQIIRTGVELITTDVIVRDPRGQFIADLKKDEFEIFEDGVRQQLVSFTLTHGGRVFNVAAPPPPPPQEGIILPPPRPTNDAAGRIFLIFVDDLHLDFRNTARIKELFKKIAKELIHEGDMFGIVSTGPSSLSIDLTYDRKRLDQAIEKISGAGLSPKDILDVPEGAQGPPEVRYRAHVAFSTANDVINNLAQVHNRRKAFIYVSNGYDFNPFKETRKKQEAERFGAATDPNQCNGGANCDNSGDNNSEDNNPFSKQGNEFYQADLISELSWLTRNANKANVTMYTIDPRGLVGMPDLDEKIDMVEWQDYVRTSQDTLRTIAELTGGYAAVNQNDFDKALKRIDSETSDYYVVGYYSNNPDPRKKNRTIDVKVTRPGLNVMHRTSYRIKAASGSTSPSK